jgi:hypothetical protein
MSFNPKVIEAIEQLNYRVTVGDVAVRSGLELQVAQPALMALASEAGGHLQVTETGEVAYLFAQNFRSVLRAKFLKLRYLERTVLSHSHFLRYFAHCLDFNNCDRHPCHHFWSCVEQ